MKSTKSASSPSSSTGGASANPSSNASPAPVAASPAPSAPSTAVSIVTPVQMAPFITTQFAVQGACDAALGTVAIELPSGLSGAAYVPCGGGSYSTSLSIAAAPSALSFRVFQSNPNGSVASAIMRKVNYTLGLFKWSRSLIRADMGAPYAYASATDAAGGTYVVGHGLLGANTDATNPGFIAKVDPQGGLAWTKQYKYTGISAKIGKDGQLYVGGWGEPGTVFVAKVDAVTGVDRWFKTFTTASSEISVDADKNGNVYVSYGAALAKLDMASNLLWQKSFTATYDLTQLAVDDAGYIYAAGRDMPITGVLLRKLEPVAGAEVWKTLLPDTVAGVHFEIPQALVASPDGKNIYVGGRMKDTRTAGDTGGHGFFGKYDGLGQPVWVKAVNAGPSNYDVVSGLALDLAGNVYVTGHTDGSLDGPNQGLNDVFFRLYSPSGSVILAKQHGGAADQKSALLGSAGVDDNGNIYVTSGGGTVFQFH